jgi:hypothetical protein
MLADVVWPALYLAAKLYSLIPILAGLLFELLVLRYLFPMPWKKALLVDIVMNAASALVGYFVFPWVGLAWEFTGGEAIDRLLGWGTFNPIGWATACAMAVFLSAGIEALVVRWIFRFAMTKRRFWAIALANLGSTAIAFVRMVRHPPNL